MAIEREYLLGTHDVEVQRLGLQHRVWRPRVLDAWQRAGFTGGHTLIDLGCGPGFASLDLAEIAGPGGQVVAVDQSARFLAALDEMARARGLSNIRTFERDLNAADLPAVPADGAWCRWIFAFVRDPRALLARLSAVLKPGAGVVIHEYFDYGAWRVSPREPDFEAFVAAAIDNWRHTGGEPDIGLDLPRWLPDAGLEPRSLTTLVDIVAPSSIIWQWPVAFVRSGVERFVAIGALTRERGDAMLGALDRAEGDPRSLMVTPAVVEIVAVKRGSPS
jgi:SAM-dependent methyltransferase